MAVRAGSVTVNLSAGTATFVRDMEVAKAKIKEFGQAHGGTVSEMKATASTMKILEGHFLNNSRAADGFLEKVLKVGPALQAAFPVVGAIAFAGIIIETGHKVYEFFAKAQEEAEKAKSKFEEFGRSLQTTNDELQVSNDRLENEIAKLEGKPENALKISLDDAKVSADHLADALARDNQRLSELLKQNEVSKWSFKAIFGAPGGVALTTDVKEGQEEFERKINEITKLGNADIHGATGNQEKSAAAERMKNAISFTAENAIDSIHTQIAAAEQIQAAREAHPKHPEYFGADQSDRLQQLRLRESLAMREEEQAAKRVTEILDKEKLAIADAAKKLEEAQKKIADANRKFGDERFKAQQGAFKEIQGPGMAVGGVHATIDAAGGDKKIAAEGEEYARQLKRELAGLQELDRTQNAADLSRMSSHQRLIYQIDLDERAERVRLHELLVAKGIDENQYYSGIAEAAEQSANRRKQAEADWGLKVQEAQSKLASLHEEAGLVRLNATQQALARIDSVERKEMIELEKNRHDQLIEYDKYEQGRTDIAKKASLDRQKVIDQEGDRLAAFLDRNIRSAHSFADAFKNIARDLESVAEKLIFRQIAAMLTPSGGGAAKSGGFFSGLVSGLFKGLSGFAAGGDIPAGQAGIVGENGIELAFGPKTIVPMSQMAGTVNHFHIDARGADAGVELRIYRAMRAMGIGASQQGAVNAREMALRTPSVLPQT